MDRLLHTGRWVGSDQRSHFRPPAFHLPELLPLDAAVAAAAAAVVAEQLVAAAAEEGWLCPSSYQASSCQ